jgi:hypothetical protein
VRKRVSRAFNEFSHRPDTEIVECHHDLQLLVQTRIKSVEKWQRYAGLKFLTWGYGIVTPVTMILKIMV